RLRRFPQALEGYRATLAEGIKRGLMSSVLQVDTVVGQLAEWLDTGSGSSWFADFTAAGPQQLRAELDEGAAAATAAVAELRDRLRDVYGPAAVGTTDAVGRERYARFGRYWNGVDLDLDEAYSWAWGEFHRLDARMRAAAQEVRPGATP